MAKKRTMIFDATVLFSFYDEKGGNRSGIYFTECNILKGLIKSGLFHISLYGNLKHDDRIVRLAKNDFGEDIRVYLGIRNKYGRFLKKVAAVDRQLRRHGRNLFAHALNTALNLLVYKPVRFLGNIRAMPRFDLAFSPCDAFPDTIRAKHKYLVLSDAIPLLLPQYFERPGAKRWFGKLVQYLKSKPDCQYFAISKSSKNDFVRLLDMDPNDITVIPLAANDNFRPVKDALAIERARTKYRIPAGKRYVFSLCTLEPRKNLLRAVKTFVEFLGKNAVEDMVFVLGGGHWTQFVGQLEAELEDLGQYRNKIIRAGYIDDADLAALYSGAEWFVYTSQYEGFGLPPLEAMQCGCPVVASNTSSLPEVMGDAGVMVDWDNDGQHVAAYEKYYFDDQFRRDMAERGLARAKEFSWDKTAEAIIRRIQENG